MRQRVTVTRMRTSTTSMPMATTIRPAAMRTTATPTTTEAHRPRLRRPAAPLTAAALLNLMRLASPALPVGGFSYSEALEAAVEAGLVSGEDAARDWLLHQL